MQKEKVIIIGAGALGKQLCHYINTFSATSAIAGFADDIKSRGEEILPRVKVQGKLNEIENLIFDKLLMGIGYNFLPERQQLFEKFSSKYSFEGFIHPNSCIDESAKIGKGVIILSGCVIDQGVTIEDNVFLYNSVTLAHDCIIRKGSFLAPSVTVSGFSAINECCFIGVGSIVTNNIFICANTKIGAGSLVIKDINEPGWYAGNPCSIMSKK